MKNFDWQLLGQFLLALLVIVVIVLSIINAVDCYSTYGNTPSKDAPFRCTVMRR